MRKRATLCKWERGINMACLSVSYVCLARTRCFVVAPTPQPFTVDTHETSESNAHCHAVGNAARLLKNSQNRYEYNAFTLFTHSLARTRFFAHLCRRAKRISPNSISVSLHIEFILLSWICMSVARNIQMSCGCVLDCLIETRWLLWILLLCIDVSTHGTRMLCGSLGQIIESYLPLHWVAVRLFTTCATSFNMAAIELGSSCQLSLGALSSARAGNSLCRQCKVEHKWMANVIMDMNTCASACSLGQKATQVATFKGAVGYVVSILLSIGCCKKCLNCFKFKF